MALSSTQHLAALQFPWFAKRASRPSRMIRVVPPCTTSTTTTATTVQPRQSSTRTEDLRRQVVGLVEAKQGDVKYVELKKTDNTTTSPIVSARKQMKDLLSSGDKVKINSLRNMHNKGTRLYPPAGVGASAEFMTTIDPHAVLREAMKKRSKTVLNADTKSKPKIVRFKMGDFAVNQKPTGTLSPTEQPRLSNMELPQSYEIRGNAISLRKEGLKGLLAYKDLYTENDKKQNSFQTSLKIYKRRLKLNQEKFIQPNETTTDDYVIHPISPQREVISPTLLDDTSRQSSRPRSSHEHVRILRSALQNKRAGGPIMKQTDNVETGEVSNKNIHCSYRLPENPNWSKEVSFKDIKDDTIPSVKTYVLEDESSSARTRKGSVESSVTLTSHNLGVHNSITNITGKKVKFGEHEVSFDPRFLDWLEDSYSNSKIHRFFPMDENFESPVVAKRHLSGRS